MRQSEHIRQAKEVNLMKLTNNRDVVVSAAQEMDQIYSMLCMELIHGFWSQN